MGIFLLDLIYNGHDICVDNVTMLPNILQLVGAILTLTSALSASLVRIRDLRDDFVQTYTKSTRMERIKKDTLVEVVSNLKSSSKEFKLGIIGIILIIAGYVTATIDIDYKDYNTYLFIIRMILIYLNTIAIINICKILKDINKFRSLLVKRSIFTIMTILLLCVALFGLPYDKFMVAFIYLTTCFILFMATSLIVEFFDYKQTKKLISITQKGLPEKLNGAHKNLTQAVDNVVKVTNKITENIIKTRYNLAISLLEQSIFNNVYELLVKDYYGNTVILYDVKVLDLLVMPEYGEDKYIVKAYVYCSHGKLIMELTNVYNIKNDSWTLLDPPKEL